MRTASPSAPTGLAGPAESLLSPAGVGRGLGRLRGAVRALAGRAVGPAVRWRLPGIVLFHALAFGLTLPAAFLVRFDGAIPPEYLDRLWAVWPAAVLVKTVVFLAMGSHRGWWRYASFADLTTLAAATAVGTLAFSAADAALPAHLRAPRSVPLLDGAATLLVLGGARAAIRLGRERFRPMISGRKPARVLVVGADEVGMALVNHVRRHPGLAVQVVGFLDDAPSTRGRVLEGVRVLGAVRDAVRLAAQSRAEAVLVPTPSVPSSVVRALAEACDGADLKVQVVPRFDSLINGTVVARPRDVEVEDLLAREPVRLDGGAIGRLVRGRVVLVTGAAGSIGSEICRQVLAFDPERVVLLDHSENGLFFLEKELKALARGPEVVPFVASITDRPRLREAFDRFRPSVVFHAAAHKHVPMMEANPGEAVKTNVFGTKNAADEAARAGVETFVLISTDKAVKPSSVMGACKRLAEVYCRSLTGASRTRLVAVRFGNVLGSAGSVVPVFQEQIRRGGPVTVTHPEMTRYFMTIPEASQLVLQAGAMGRGGEVFVLDMGEPVRIVDLARAMIRLSGLAVGEQVEIAFTGLRPGEKLHEELHDRDERCTPTSHPKVMVIRQPDPPARRTPLNLDRLSRALEGSGDVVEALAALVPDYRPGPRPGSPRRPGPPPLPLPGDGPASAPGAFEPTGNAV